ncbi:MAG: HAMP domain-containing sensor histidine kinase [Acidimicrobiales bacterium]
MAWIRRTSFRTRLSVLVALAVGVAVAVAALASYVAVSRQLYRSVDNELRAAYQRIDSGPDPVQISACDFVRTKERFLLTLGRQGDQTQLISSDGQVLASSADMGQCPPPSANVVSGTKADIGVARSAADPNGAGTVVLHNVSASTGRYRVLTFPIGHTLSQQGVAVMVLHPLSDLTHTLADLRLILLIVALAGIAVAMALGYVVARATIRPVERLTAAAEHVAATQQLDATIVEAGDDELARLAHAFNAMLEALGASRQQQAQLVSDAGHELRTPLTSLRTNIEVLMRVHDLPPADRAELLADVRGQLEELTTLIGDVVELARRDEQQPEPTEIRLDQVVAQAVERARRRAISVTFEVTLDTGSVRAQPALLERAILNVLDNAAKWSPPGGTVTVSLRRRGVWQLDVRDRGPGIAPEDLPKVFDRFYRAPSARSMPGSGLGLAIVRQVVTAHGGTVTATTPDGEGTLVHIELPTVVEDEPTPAHEVPGPLPVP